MRIYDIPDTLETLLSGNFVALDDGETVRRGNLYSFIKAIASALIEPVIDFIGTDSMGTEATTITGAIGEIRDDLVAIKQVDASGSVASVAAGAAVVGAFDITPPEGYTRPLGVVGWYVSGTNSTFAMVSRVFLTNANQISYVVRNTLVSTSLDDLVMHTRILWGR